MSEPFVVATTCVRRRPWAARPWLGAMAAQARKPDAVLVVVDEPEDRVTELTWGVVASDCERNGLAPTKVVAYPHPSAPGWSRGTRESGWREPEPGASGRYSDDQHAHLARLRNWTVERALELWPQCTHVWCTDSDVAPEPDVLELLLAADKEVVAAVVRNGERAWNFFSGESWRQNPPEPYRNGTEPLIVTCKEPVKVTMTGASILLRLDAIKAGYRWAPDLKGEDVGAAKIARAHGIELWLHPIARTLHYFNGPDEEPLS